MSARHAVRLAVDAAMFCLMLFMMSYPMTRGLARHGIGGLILVLLVITHHLLNAAWYRTLSRGRWRGRRFLVNATGCLLVAVFLAFTASALAMAGDTYPFFPFRMPFWGRGLHTAMTAWLFVLASFHLGLHGASVWNRAERFAGRVRSALFLLLLAAGTFCFVQSGLWNDMLFLGGPKYFPGGMTEFLVWHLGTAFFSACWRGFSLLAPEEKGGAESGAAVPCSCRCKPCFFEGRPGAGGENIVKYTELGKSGITVSKICAGGMSFGKPGTMHDWTLNGEDTEKVVKAALDLGINFFDTANCYSQGTSEEYLGRALKRNVDRHKVVIASKVYFNPGRLSREAIAREIDGTLKRLGTDYLDLYIIHRFDYETPVEETMEALDALVRAGKVRALGASAMYGYQFFRMQTVARENGWAMFQAMENHYNLLYREDERELIPICREMNVSLMPYSPLAGGHLTRPQWESSTLRGRTDLVARGKYDHAREQDMRIVRRVAGLAEKYGVKMAQIALAWEWARGVASPIVGATKASYLEDAAHALDLTLTQEDVAYLEEAYLPHKIIGAIDHNPEQGVVLLDAVKKEKGTVTLNNGVEMPRLGLGVFQVTDQDLCRNTVREALGMGYRLIDTAACYGNERAVGDAVRESGVDRGDVFLCSKVWIQDAGYEKTLLSFAKTLENLQTDYLDLYLIHMPYGDYHGSWRAMEELYRKGKVRAIGVCNFLPNRLEDLILSHDIVPAVNQIELHPFSQRKELRELMRRNQIVPMAWAPFAEGLNGIFTRDDLSAIGKKHGKTPAQVVLRWLIQSGAIAIPKSVHAERLHENLSVTDFALDDEDMDAIGRMDTGRSLILDLSDPAEVDRLHGIRFIQ